jgi:colicin import membrane protein
MATKRKAAKKSPKKKAPAKKKAAARKKKAVKKSPAKKKAPAKKKKSNAGTAKLKKITTRAQAIYKDGKGGKKWIASIKQAARELK